MKLPQVVEVKGIRVLTTHQIAESYEAKEIQISQNFKNNRQRFVEGKHYISLSGDDLRTFKNQLEKIEVVKSRTSHLYLWTEKGALLHAKSLNTDKAWQVYDYLVDFYFRAKEKESETFEKKEVVPTQTKTEPVKQKPMIPTMEEPIFVFKNLLALAEEQGITLKLQNLQGFNSILKGNRIAISKDQAFENVVYEAAYELAHYFIHYKNGNLISSPLAKDYNVQSEHAAFMMIRMLDIKAKQKY